MGLLKRDFSAGPPAADPRSSGAGPDLKSVANTLYQKVAAGFVKVGEPRVKIVTPGMETFKVNVHEIRGSRSRVLIACQGFDLIITPSSMLSLPLNLAQSLSEYTGAMDIEVGLTQVDCYVGPNRTKRVIYWVAPGGSNPYPEKAHLKVEQVFKQAPQPKAENSMKELNTAVLIRRDTRTVKVTFPIRNIEGGYTFATNINDLKVGEQVICDCSPHMAIGEIVEVHDTVTVPPESTLKLEWIIGRVDLTAFKAIQAENKIIEDQVAEFQRKSLQQGYRERILGGLSKEELLALPAAAR